MTIEQKECRRCGNCCKQGGPALHLEDLELIRNGKIPIRSLITIRRGELVSNPLTGRVQPAAVELVKIVGTGRQWDCCYYDSEVGCTVYEDRPHTCRVLKCWDTEEIEGLVEKDTLTRFDIIEKNDPLIPVIQEHERVCPCEDFGYIQANLLSLPEQKRSELEKRVRQDLHFRSRVIQDFQLNLSEELFYFGRPLFQLLQQLGVRVTESPLGLRLSWAR